MVSGVLCGLPTPTGPCRRLVSVPGGPCGVTHTDTLTPTGLPPLRLVRTRDHLGADPLGGDGPVGSFPGPAVEALAAASHLISSGQEPGCENEWDRIWDDLAPLGDPAVAEAAAAAAHAADQHQRFTDRGDPRYDGTVDDIWVSLSSVDLGGLSAVVERYTQVLDDDDIVIAARGRRPEGRCWAAERAGPEELAELAGDPVGKVRYIVAARTDDPALLARLADDTDQWVAEEALLNRRCPDAALESAASHPHPRVAAAAAAGAASTPPDQLAALAANPSWRVRQRIAGRADLPAGVLAVLANDGDGFVAAAARANPAFTGAEAAHAGLLTD